MRILLFLALVCLGLGAATLPPFGADVAVSKSGPELMIIGYNQPYTYVVNIANAGPQDANNVIMTDPIPGQFVISTVTPQYSNGTIFCDPVVNQLVRCTVVTLRIGDVARVFINVTVPANLEPFTANNTAYVTASNIDPDLANNANSRLNPVVLSADLSISIQGPSEAIAGQSANLTETVRIVNLGFSDARNVVSRFKIQDPLTFQGVQIIQGSGSCAFDSSVREVICNFGTLVTGTPAALSYVVYQGVPPNALLPSGGTVQFWASVNSTTPDPNYDNNNATHSVRITVESDVSVTKGSIPVVIAGQPDTVLFTIVVDNAGPSTAQGVVMTDQIPAPFVLKNYTIACNVTPQNKRGVRFTKADMHSVSLREGAPCTNELACTIQGNFLRCTVNYLNIPERVVITVEVGIPSTAYPATGLFPFEVTNYADVRSLTADNNPDRNRDPANVTILIVTDIAVTKTGFAGTIISGDGVTYYYTIVTVNNGPSFARSVTMNDTVPSPFVVNGNAIVDVGPGSCTRNGNFIACSFGDMEVGASRTVRIPFFVPSNVPTTGNIVNTACVRTLSNDTTPANDCSSWSNLVVLAPDVGVTKVGPSQIIIGSTQVYYYTIRVFNSGPSTALNGVLRDVVPAPFVVQEPVTTTRGSCSINATNRNSIVCDFGELPFPIEVVVIVPFTVPVTATVPNVANTAYVFSTTPDRNPDNNNSTFETILIRQADVRVIKGGPASLCAGSQGTYSVQVFNAGPSDAVAVVLVDTLPSNLVPGPNSNIQITGAAGGASCSFTGQVLTCNLGNMASQAIVVVSYTASVAPGTPAGIAINVANGTSSTLDPDLSNNVANHTTSICANADLAIQKSAPVTAIAGQGVYQYQLTITNNGPADSVNVRVSDAIPLDFTPQLPISDSNCQYVVAGAQTWLNCSYARLVAGESRVVTFPFTVAATVGAGLRINCADVFSLTTTDPNPANNRACANTTVEVRADLLIEKTGPASICAGFGGSFTVRVTNNGPSTATGVQVSDSLNSVFTPGSSGAITPAGLCSFVGQTLSCSLGSLSLGQSVTITYPVSVAASVPAQFNVANTASVTSSSFDPNLSNNNSTHLTNICAQADIRVAKTGPATVSAGSASVFQYTLTVTNGGPANAVNVAIDDPIPSGFVVSGTPTATAGGSCSVVGQFVRCTWGSKVFVNGESQTVTVQFTVPPSTESGVYQNCANASSTVEDPDTSNNRACFNTQVNVAADVTILKNGPLQLCAGGASGIYTLTVTNNGPAIAQGVRVNDTIDSRFQVVRLVQPSPQCGFVGQLLTCSLGSLTVGQSVTITYELRVAVTQAAALQVPNTGYVSATTPDGNPMNDYSTIYIDICAQSDRAVTKTAPVFVDAGSQVVYFYTITVQNNGPAADTNAYIRDELPTQFTAGAIESVSVSGGGSCSYAGTLPVVLTCTWASFPVGANYTVVVPFTVASSTPAGTVQNCVTVFGTNVDPISSNNTACASSTVRVYADVGIFKTGPGACLVAGSSNIYQYTVTVNNVGPAFAQNVVVADTIPGALSGVLGATVTPAGAATCTYVNGALGCTASGALAPGASFTVTFGFQVAAFQQNSTVTNTATVTTTTTQNNTSNDSSSFTNSICAAADLAIVKSGPVSVIAGETNLQQFVLQVQNNGPADAYSVTVSDDSIPANVFAVSAVRSSLGANCSIVVNSPSTTVSVSCFYAVMRVGQQDTITIDFRVPASAVPGTYPNCAQIQSSVTYDPIPSNNRFCINVVIIAQADLLTTKTGPSVVTAGVNGAQNVYTITVRNIGGSDAQSATLVDAIPSVFQATSVSTTKGSCTLGGSNSVSCAFGTLVPGEVVTITVPFTVSANAALGAVVNTACANTTTAESNYANNCASWTTTVVCSAVNTISKSDGVSTVIAGNTTAQTFTIVVTNQGPSVSRETVVTDTFPLSVYTVTAGPTTSRGTCTASATGFVCNVGTLGVNESATILVSYIVAANVQATSATNTACAKNSCGPAEICAVDTNTIVRVSDLSIIKDDCVETVLAGSTTPVTFTITARNNGPSDATNVVISDQWPSVYQQGTLTTSPSTSCTLTGTNFACTWANVAAGASVQVYVSYTVAGSTPPQFATNCANVTSSPNNDNNLDNNQDCDTNRIIAEADLEVTKTIDQADCLTAGVASSVYRVNVLNKGPSTAYNVVVTDTFPAGLTVLSNPGCTVSGRVYTCFVGTLASGASASFAFQFSVPADALPGLVENKVYVNSTTPDPELCNNNATVCSIICAESDLGVVKTDSQLEVTAGDLKTYTYTITGTNYGPSTARNVTFTDLFPAEFVRGNVSAEGGIVTYTTEGFRVTYPSLAVGASYTIYVNYTVAACQQACIACNYVTISSPYPDPNTSNNQAKDCTAIRTEANLEVCKSDGVTTVTAGDGVIYRYTVQVSNVGPSCAQAVRLIDHFPVQVLQIAGTLITTQGSCINTNGSDFSCNLLTLQPGQTVTVWVNYTVPANTSTCSVCNLVAVSSQTFDPELCNNDARDCNALVERATLSLSKTDNVQVIQATDTTPHTYTLVVRNNGPSTARDVVVTDRWPAGATQFLNSLVISQGRCVGFGRDFSCSVGDLAVGAQATISVSFSLTQPASCNGVISNNAAAFSPTDETCREAQDNNTIVGCVTREAAPVVIQQEARAIPTEEVFVKRDAPAQEYTPRTHTGKVLTPKVLGVEITGTESFEVVVKSTNVRPVEIEGVSILVTLKSGKTTIARLGEKSENVQSDCLKLRGMTLRKGWTASCKVSFADAKDVASFKFDVRGTSEVPGGYHPMMGSSSKKL